MQKLINAYKKNPTIATAMRLVIHSKRHPMAACLLGVEDSVILRDAIKAANDTEIGA